MPPCALVAADATPLSDADRSEFVAEKTAPRSFLGIGIIAVLPLVGSIGLYPREDGISAVSAWNIKLGGYEIWAEMPELRADDFPIPNMLRPLWGTVWSVLASPVLLAALAFQMLRTAVFGASDWRARRAYLHIMRRVCPKEFDTSVAAWRDHPVLGREAMRLYEERRVSERMAALVAA